MKPEMSAPVLESYWNLLGVTSCRLKEEEELCKGFDEAYAVCFFSGNSFYPKLLLPSPHMSEN